LYHFIFSLKDNIMKRLTNLGTTGYQFTATKDRRITTEKNYFTEMSAIKAAKEYIALGWKVDNVMHTNTSIVVKTF